jgi:hypothetical protein
MLSWEDRPKEIAFLLNPAFCGRLIYGTIHSYYSEIKRPFPFVLVYLILPLLLHKKTRSLISSKTQFINWAQNHEECLIQFPERAKDLVEITNEALEFLLQCNLLSFTASAELKIALGHSISKTKFVDPEVKECVTKSEHIGRWFARTGSVDIAYITLGVKP